MVLGSESRVWVSVSLGFWVQSRVWVQSLGFWVQSRGFWVQSLGFWVQSPGNWVQSLRV